MYIIINFSPEGEAYSLHNTLEEAQNQFNQDVQYLKDSDFKDDSVYLVSVDSGTKFGFNTKGKIYGGELISEFTLYPLHNIK